MEKILVVGSSGPLSKYLKQKLGPNAIVIGRSAAADSYFDANNRATYDIIARSECSSAIILVSYSTFKECEENPAIAYDINVRKLIDLATILAKYKVHITYISSSAVFGQSCALKLESTNPIPDSVYGTTKLQAEREILFINKNATIIRPTKIVDTNLPILLSWRHSIKINENLEAMSSRRLAPLSVSTVASKIIEHCRLKTPGVIHMSTDRDLSYSAFASRLFPGSTVKKTDLDDNMEEGLTHTSLSAERNESTIVKLDESIDQIKAETSN